MRKYLPLILLSILFSVKSFAAADDVYHERTSNTIGGGCGIFVNNLSPTSANTVTIGFRIANQGFTNQAKIYYTIDGTNPSGSKGTASGTTMVLNATYTCTFSDVNGTYDVVFATIPAYPTGTVVNYIVSAYSNFGLEIFGNGGTASSSGLATLFTYTVGAVLPITMVSFTGKKEGEGVKLSWVTSQEINADRYEVYSSVNGTDFKYIGLQKAVGNTNLTTQYTFLDSKPNKGNNFYRLRSVDKDGRFTHSKIINIAFGDKRKPTVNSTGTTLRVNVNSGDKQNYSVIMVNDLGQAVKNWTIADNGTFMEHILDLPPNVKRAVYRIGIKGNGPAFTQSLFIR